MDKLENSSVSIQHTPHVDVPWEPPFPDAVSVIIDHLLDPATVEPLSGFSDSELQAKKRIQRDIYLNDPDYAGLRPGLGRRKQQQQLQLQQQQQPLHRSKADPAPISVP